MSRVLERYAEDRLDRMEPQLELRDDAEVAAAATEPPEQLGVVLLGSADPLPRRGDELGAGQAVTGEAELGGEVADAPAQRQSGDAGRTDHAAGCGQPMLLGGGVEVEPGGAAA